MDDERRAELTALAGELGHRFADLTLLDRALSHSSYVHEHPDDAGEDNERLEFLGDAVLELVITRHLFHSFPDAREGQLSRARSSVVNEARLAAHARQLDLGSHLLLGKGEELQGGRDKPSLLADAMEAVAAALYLDGGFAAAQAWLVGMIGEEARAALGRAPRRDYKTRLQEKVQERLKVTPRYRLLEATGPDHDKSFRVELVVEKQAMSQGVGKSKKEAEQDAARQALELLHSLEASE